MTETATRADVIFPAASSYEKDGTFTNAERRIQRVREKAQKLAGASLPGTKPAAAPKPKPESVPEPPMLADLPEFKVEFGGGAPPPAEQGRGNLRDTSPWDDLDPLAPPKRQKK